MGGLKTLAVDLGSTCGFAVGHNGIIKQSGEVALLPPTGQTHPGHRFMKFQEWLSNFTDVDEILYEEVPRFESAAAARVYCGLLCVLQMFSLAHGIRISSLKASQIKKDFTGYGNAPKEVICEVAINLGWKKGVRETRDFNNEADAIALFWVVCLRRNIAPAFETTD